MDRDKYLAIQQQLVLLASLAQSLDEDELIEFINTGSRSLTVSSIFHPTLNIMAGKQLQGIMGIARAVVTFKKTVTEAQERIGEGARTAQAYRAMGVEVE